MQVNGVFSRVNWATGWLAVLVPCVFLCLSFLYDNRESGHLGLLEERYCSAIARRVHLESFASSNAQSTANDCTLSGLTVTTSNPG